MQFTATPKASTASSPVSVTTRYARRLGIGSYEFVVRLGSGGTGDVYLALFHGAQHFRKLCVIKKLRDEVAHLPRARQSFHKEGYLAARLNHPNVVQTYEVGEEAEVPFMAMEHLEGQTLRTLLSASRATGIVPDFGLWVRVVADALAGLHHLHELTDFDGSRLGAIHRDVSPHNLFITYDGRVCLLDFGAAKLAFEQGSVECRTLTGKLGYMAPEYVTGGGIDRRADVFSMGVVLWEALAGRKMPNAGLTPAECCRARPRVTTVQRRVDFRLDAIVTRALEVDPARRFPTARAMRDALEEWLLTAGRAPRQSDIGDYMAAYFDEDRRRMAQSIRQRVEAIPAIYLQGAPSDADLHPLGCDAEDDERGPMSDYLGRGPSSATGSQSPSPPFLLRNPRPPAARDCGGEWRNADGTRGEGLERREADGAERRSRRAERREGDTCNLRSLPHAPPRSGTDRSPAASGLSAGGHGQAIDHHRLRHAAEDRLSGPTWPAGVPGPRRWRRVAYSAAALIAALGAAAAAFR